MKAEAEELVFWLANDWVARLAPALPLAVAVPPVAVPADSIATEKLEVSEAATLAIEPIPVTVTSLVVVWPAEAAALL